MFSAIGVLLLVAGASAYVYLSHTIVPNVTDLSPDSAIKSIRENGLIDELKTNHPYDPSSVVVGQSPVHGWIVKKNSPVQYWNEESPSQILHNNQPADDNSGNTPDEKPTDHVIVPDVVGELQSEATTTLLDAGFYEVTAFGGDILSPETKYVVKQSIEAGETVEKGETIELMCIAKPLGTQIIVPSVIGMEQMQATQLLTEAGLQYQVWWTEEDHTGATEYYIIDQSIPEGSTVTAGTLIRLELSDKSP